MNPFLHSPSEPPARKAPRVAAREQILDLVKNQPAVMSTGGQPHIYLETAGHAPSTDANLFAVPLDSDYLRGYLTVRHVGNGHPAPSDAQLRQALRVREADCLGGRTHNQRVNIGLRYAWNPRYTRPDADAPTPAFVLSLNTEKGRHVAVTGQGWSVEPTYTSFLYAPLQQPLQNPLPPQGDPHQALQPFRKLLRLDNSQHDATWQTLLNWTRAAMRAPKNATFHDYPILNLMGPEGSGKSLTAKLLAQLLDPTLTPIHSFPSTERRLHGLAASHHILAFDEPGKINPEKSRYLSRLSSGVTSLHRQIQGMLVRPIILTTTDETETRHLAGKVVNVDLPPIDAPLPQEEIEQQFESMRPQILGALLTLLTLNFTQPAPCLPNRKTKNQKIEESVTDFLRQNGGVWQGIVSDLLSSVVEQPFHCPQISVKALSQLLEEMTGLRLTRFPRKNSQRLIRLEVLAKEIPQPKPIETNPEPAPINHPEAPPASPLGKSHHPITSQ